MLEKKYFTVEEANRLIPRLTTIVRELRRSREHLQQQRPTAETVAQKAGGNGGGADTSAYLFEYAQSLRRDLAELEAMGVVLKDVDRGLVDFPHLRGGREVYLCWEMGERQINYWHDIDSGYAGRQPL